MNEPYAHITYLNRSSWTSTRYPLIDIPAPPTIGCPDGVNTGKFAIHPWGIPSPMMAAGSFAAFY